ncbi:MAG: hypothetical protein JNM34_09075 [Chthonomonadaceae bacterium]|nr:hypothetical protein [Chthonomonadaceae bacterium]
MSPAWAQLTVTVPAEGDPPKYFSGTNSRINAKAVTSGSQHVASLKVFIEGQEAYSTTSPTPPPFKAEIKVSLMFDSTHFEVPADGKLTVRAEATDENGTLYVKEIEVPVSNKAVLFQNPFYGNVPGGDGFTPTKAALEACNYTIAVANNTGSWTKANVMAALEDCNAFYVNTHGTTTPKFQTPAGDWVTVPDVLTSRTNAIGTDLPPFNSTGKPPMSISFIDSCDTSQGQNNAFGDAFQFPNKNEYNRLMPEDQAHFGWQTLVAAAIANKWNTYLWSALQSGITASKARDEAVIKMATIEKVYILPTQVWLTGDANARLHNVYTGTELPAPTPWVRVIPNY